MSSVVMGREQELVEANAFLEGAARGTHGLLLDGEPGIGKTTVWAAVVDEARSRGFRLLQAHPAEAESELAFGVLTDLLADVDDETLDPLPAVQRSALETALRRCDHDTAVDPTAIALATLGALERLSAAGPVLVGIDDLQWVDAPSARALGFAFRRLRGVPVGLLATMRTGFQGELGQLATRDDVTVVGLPGLGEHAIAQLVFDRTGRALTPAQLHRLTDLSGGNPFYALELASTGDPELALPESLAATLRARLAGLSAEARSVGLTAATLGRFDEHVPGGVEGKGLDELRAAGIVAIRAGAPVFAHPLLASTLLELHTTEERRAVHRSLARVLPDPDERALHLGRGSDRPSERVASELERTAARLDARGAPETAATLAERAATLTPPEDEVASSRRLLLASDLYQAAGEGRDHVLPLLEHLAGTLPPGPRRARVLVRLGWLGAQLDTMPMSESVSFQERALAEADEAPDVTAAAQAVLARLRGIGGDYRAALRHAELAVDAEGAHDANPMFPSPAGELAIARFFAGAGLDEGLLASAVARESKAGRRGEPYQSAELQLGLALLYAGELSRARTILMEQLERSVELGRVRSTAGCVLHLTELEVRAGDLGRAQAHAHEFLHLDRQLRGDLSAEWYPSGLVASHLGRADEARRILTAGTEESRAIGSTIWLAHQLEALGHLELAAGNLAEARDALAPVVPLLRSAGLGEWSAHPVHPDLIETLVGLGELDEAVALHAELEAYGRRLDRPWGLATAARSAALIESARGAPTAALEAVERALVEHERLDWPLERARTLLVAGAVLRRLGRRRDAGGALAEAHALLETLGNPLWLARVRAEEGRLGGRRGAGDALTPAEERVAALAGQGLRNAEIAARLYVTPKTVETTLSHVYRKLGVRSRTELARRLPNVDRPIEGDVAPPSSRSIHTPR